MKKFGRDDLFINRVKTHPYFDFLVYDTQVVLNGKTRNEQELEVANGNIDLYEMNVGRGGANLVQPFVYKSGTRTAFKTVSTASFNALAFGDTITGSYPLSSSIQRFKYAEDGPREFVLPLKNTLNWYSNLSPHFEYSSSIHERSYDDSSINLITIPSIFYGSAIKKGSIEMNFYVSGVLAGQLQDKNLNGELIETTGSREGSVAGVVLYNEGFILLTASYALTNHTSP